MATRYVNATIGTVSKEGIVSSSAVHSSTTGSDLSVAWDDTKITTKRHFKAALDAIKAAVAQLGNLPE